MKGSAYETKEIQSGICPKTPKAGVTKKGQLGWAAFCKGTYSLPMKYESQGCVYIVSLSCFETGFSV